MWVSNGHSVIGCVAEINICNAVTVLCNTQWTHISTITSGLGSPSDNEDHAADVCCSPQLCMTAWLPLIALLAQHHLSNISSDPLDRNMGRTGGGEEGLATVSAHLQYPPLRNQLDTSDNTILTLGWKHLELEVSSVGYTSILGNEMYVHCNNIFSPIHGS